MTGEALAFPGNGAEAEKINNLFIELCGQPEYPFPAEGSLALTTQKGVYIIYCGDSVVHVGNTRNGKAGICQRLKDHIYGRSSFFREFLRPRQLSVREGFSFRYLEVPDARERVLLEALACGLLCPHHIGLHTVRE